MDEQRPTDIDPGQWATIAARVRTLQGDPHGTLRPQARALGSTGRGVLSAFGPEGVSADGEATGSLEIGDVLGEGGMGVVRLATQTTMGRDVAVKALRPERRTPQRTLKLLQEAWTAGRLEHPNIVPVYDIATDAQGEPLIVLKRIEGEAWSALLADPEHTREAYRVDDLLEWHLRILMQVCNAIHFAHDRGIVHLDLKPDNVMVGRHGEVYVVDWGIAMTLEDDRTGHLPVAKDCAEIVGTPHYMAPEMLLGEGQQLSRATDVFLLGATLYEVLTGQPPHQGETLMEVMRAAMCDDHTWPQDQPAELVAIGRTSMARSPGDRYPDAEAVLHALQSFLNHRESGRLAQLADERLQRLERALAEPDAAGPSGRELFAQVRFGFEQALASWPGNEAAREGLSRAVRVMVEHELDHGDPKVAAALAKEHAELPEELTSRVEAAVAAAQANLDALQKLGQAYNPLIGQRTRRFVLAVLGMVWAAVPLLAYLEVFVVPLTYENLAIPGLVSVVLLLGFSWWARESLGKTRVNRIAMLTAIFCMGSEVLMMLGASIVGVPAAKAFVLMSLLWSSLLGLVALTIERRMLWISGAYLCCFFVSAAWIELTMLALALTNVVFVVVVVLSWRPGAPTARGALMGG